MAVALNNTGTVKENMYRNEVQLAFPNIFENTTGNNVINVNDHNILDIEHTAIISYSL